LRTGQRVETKAASRRTLLDAAMRILDEEGESALSTTRVARTAGFAQPSFYVHFENMDDLLRALVDEVLDDWRTAVISARRAVRDAPDDRERRRDAFRTPVRQLAAHPRMFRLLLRSRLDTTSPLGDWSRHVFEQHRTELATHLATAGLPHGTAADRRRLNMIADGIMGMTSELVIGHLDGRYRNIEEMIDVLVAFSDGYLALNQGPSS
jgi:AcrR family transcriptional regulator